jgi:serine/threonine-protein kinase
MQHIGRYELIDELGRGAMGVVYRARDTQIGRIVALKIILTKSGSPEEVEHYKQRFQREAQAAGRLSHPGIVTLHDIAEDAEGQPYIVMEFIEGKPLNLLLGPTAQLPLDRLLDIGIQVAQALDYAHHCGVVHRDIKPENIMVTTAGRAKITDFGIAKLAGADMTQEGTSLGTPSYMSPEQIRGSAVDARSDVFSLGAVLYWMCTGQKPFAGESVTTITFQVVFQDPARAQQLKPGLPPDLDRILSRCLAKDPADRYRTCGDLAADLEALRAGRSLAPIRPAGTVPVERTAELPVAPAPPQRPRNDSTLPLAAPNEKTRVASTISGTLAAGLPHAPEMAARPSRLRSAWLLGAGAVLLAAIIGGAWWLRQRPSAADSAPPPPAHAPAVATNSAPQIAESPAPSVPKSETPARPPAATAQLKIICRHNFQSAMLELYVDDEIFYRAPLRGKEQHHLMVKYYEGKLEDERPIPVGHHSLRVRVFSRRDKYDDQDAVPGEFTEGDARTLEIEFGKGSGLGVTERNLNLTLH